MNEVKDVMGKPVNIGDTVAFATAGKGASGFAYGKVVRFAGRSSVGIEHNELRVGWCTVTTTVRKVGQFAIVEPLKEGDND